MKAISIKNPWAYDILCGYKNFEYRTWQTKHRGDLLICSSANPKIKGMISGHALIVCNLSDITRVTRSNFLKLELDEPPEDSEKIFAWHLTNFRMIKPFKVKGKLNLFEIDDKLIKYIDEKSMSDKEVEDIIKQYFEPLFYTGKK